MQTMQICCRTWMKLLPLSLRLCRAVTVFWCTVQQASQGARRQASICTHAHNSIVKFAITMVTRNLHFFMQLPSCQTSSMISWYCDFGVLEPCCRRPTAFCLYADTAWHTSHCRFSAALLCRHMLLLLFVTCNCFDWAQAAVAVFG